MKDKSTVHLTDHFFVQYISYYLSLACENVQYTNTLGRKLTVFSWHYGTEFSGSGQHQHPVAPCGFESQLLCLPSSVLFPQLEDDPSPQAPAITVSQMKCLALWLWWSFGKLAWEWQTCLSLSHCFCCLSSNPKKGKCTMSHKHFKNVIKQMKHHYIIIKIWKLSD